MNDSPTLDAIAALHAAQTEAGQVRITPTWEWYDFAAARVNLKLELWQVTGTFKPRGALAVMQSLGPAEQARGVVASSGGNHAVAVAYAARLLGIPAKVVMPRTASPLRQEKARAYGAELVLAEDMHAAFALGDQLATEEGRTMVHPFEGPRTALGTATIGHEWLMQVPDLEAVVIPVGGGGLIAGMAAAIRQRRPDCAVYGVEPEGADTISQSLTAGRPVRLERVSSIADSLSAPLALPYSFSLIQRYVTAVVRVSDAELRAAMRRLFLDLHLVCEPAAAAATAGLLGPLADRLRGRRVGVLVCGTNIDPARYCALLNMAD